MKDLFNEATINTMKGLLDHWWVQSLLTLFVGLCLYFVALKILDGLKTKASRTRNLFDDALAGALATPLNYAILFFTLLYAFQLAQQALDFSLLPDRKTLMVLSVAIFFSWFVLRLIRIRENQILKGQIETKSDQTTINVIFKVLRLTVVILTILVVFQTLGVSISGIIAFGGVGGAAVAFAAKDLLSNFFGGMMVFLDKPFSVGDWIRSPDQNIEGTVEHIGWRVTRIRTFDKRPLYVPNSVFAQISIENPQRMSHRRIYEHIGVRYDDFSQVENICKAVDKMLKQHEDIDDTQTLMVNFNRFSDSSLEFFIYCFTHTTHWQTFHRIKQDVLLKIGEIIEQHDAEIAFPTQTIHVASQPQVEPPQSA